MHEAIGGHKLDPKVIRLLQDKNGLAHGPLEVYQETAQAFKGWNLRVNGFTMKQGEEHSTSTAAVNVTIEPEPRHEIIPPFGRPRYTQKSHNILVRVFRIVTYSLVLILTLSSPFVTCSSSDKFDTPPTNNNRVTRSSRKDSFQDGYGYL